MALLRLLKGVITQSLALLRLSKGVITQKLALLRLFKGVITQSLALLRLLKGVITQSLALLRLLKGVITQSLALLRLLKGVIMQSLALIRLLKGVITQSLALLLLLKGVITQSLVLLRFLAHLSQRLTRCAVSIPIKPASIRPSVVRPSGRRRPQYKDLLLQNHWASHSQILCGASMGRGNKSLFPASGSHDQDGHQAHLWQKLFKNLLRNQWTDFNETWFVASRTPAHYSSCK